MPPVEPLVGKRRGRQSYLDSGPHIRNGALDCFPQEITALFPKSLISGPTTAVRPQIVRLQTHHFYQRTTHTDVMRATVIYVLRWQQHMHE